MSYVPSFDCCSHGYKIVSIIHIISLLTTITGKEWYDMINFPLFPHIIHILLQRHPYSFSYYPHWPILNIVLFSIHSILSPFSTLFDCRPRPPNGGKGHFTVSVQRLADGRVCAADARVRCADTAVWHTHDRTTTVCSAVHVNVVSGDILSGHERKWENDFSGEDLSE